METEEIFNQDSIRLLLEASIASYNDERNRTKTIDGKSGISLPIISAFALTVVHAMKYKQIVAFSSTPFSKWLIPFSLFATYSIALGLVLVSVLFMTRAIFMQRYKALTPIYFYNKKALKDENKDLFSIELLREYIAISQFNEVQNNKRVKWYQLGWIFALGSLIAYILYFFLQSIFIK